MVKRLKHILSGYIPTTRSHHSHNYKKKSWDPPEKTLHLFDFFQLVMQWEQIVGQKLATKTTPLKIYQETLQIIIPHSSWAQELSFLSSPILEKIHKLFPSSLQVIKKISFQYSASWKPLVEQFPKLKTTQHSSTQSLNVSDQHTNTTPLSFSYCHPHSPVYQQAYREAEKFFCDLENKELKDAFIKLYLQLHLIPKGS
jgi:hypothetical protein